MTKPRGQNLADAGGQGLFIIIKVLPGAGWRVGRHTIGEQKIADRLTHVGRETLHGQTGESVIVKIQIERPAHHFHFLAGHVAGHRFGNDRTEGLGKTRQLGRFQPVTFVQADTAQRPRVDSAKRGPIDRIPDHRRLGLEQGMLIRAAAFGQGTKI